MVGQWFFAFAADDHLGLGVHNTSSYANSATGNLKKTLGTTCAYQSLGYYSV